MRQEAMRNFVSWTIPLLTIFILIKPIAPQAPPEHHQSQDQSKKLAFAAVSIHRNNAGGPQQFGEATADGYSMKNMFLAAPIVTAYVPTAGGASSYADDQIIGMPNWLTSDDERYDIHAKVDEADLPNWQNPETRQTMLRSMLQSMLADRLKLVVHRSTMIGPVYRLVVGKSGPSFKETDPQQSTSRVVSVPRRRPNIDGVARRPDDDALFWNFDWSARLHVVRPGGKAGNRRDRTDGQI